MSQKEITWNDDTRDLMMTMLERTGAETSAENYWQLARHVTVASRYLETDFVLQRKTGKILDFLNTHGTDDQGALKDLDARATAKDIYHNFLMECGESQSDVVKDLRQEHLDKKNKKMFEAELSTSSPRTHRSWSGPLPKGLTKG